MTCDKIKDGISKWRDLPVHHEYQHFADPGCRQEELRRVRLFVAGCCEEGRRQAVLLLLLFLLQQLLRMLLLFQPYQLLFPHSQTVQVQRHF